MLGFFKSKPLLKEEDYIFQIETYKWLLKHFGESAFYEETQLVLPNKEFFPEKYESVEDAANGTFKKVKKFAGLEEWPCKLIAQEEDINPVIAPTIVLQNSPVSPNGTFEFKSESEILITYNPAIVSNPTHLVSTYAHELAHYLTGTAPVEPPGGWENWEFATDIAATFMGFGIFMANSSFNFSQHSGVDFQGWKSNRSGYLSEPEHCMALALFLMLKSCPIESVTKYLKANLKKMLHKALKDISNSNVIQQLKEIEFEQVYS